MATAWRDAVRELRRALLPIPERAAPLVVGRPLPEISQVVHEVVHNALIEFCAAVDAPAPPAEAPSEPVVGDRVTRLQAETAKVSFIAKMHGLHLAVAEGRVIRLASVAAAHADGCRRVRTKMLTLPASLPPRLHRYRTQAEAKRIISQAVAEALAELPAEAPTHLAGRPAPPHH